MFYEKRYINVVLYLNCRMLYYTVWGGDAPYIGWSYLDGSESGPLIGPRTDIGWPNGLALDLYGIYYCLS